MAHERGALPPPAFEGRGYGQEFDEQQQQYTLVGDMNVSIGEEADVNTEEGNELVNEHEVDRDIDDCIAEILRLKALSLRAEYTNGAGDLHAANAEPLYDELEPYQQN
jgi:hypothetical protein